MRCRPARHSRYLAVRQELCVGVDVGDQVVQRRVVVGQPPRRCDVLRLAGVGEREEGPAAWARAQEDGGVSEREREAPGRKGSRCRHCERRDGRKNLVG